MPRNRAMSYPYGARHRPFVLRSSYVFEKVAIDFSRSVRRPRLPRHSRLGRNGAPPFSQHHGSYTNGPRYRLVSSEPAQNGDGNAGPSGRAIFNSGTVGLNEPPRRCSVLSLRALRSHAWCGPRIPRPTYRRAQTSPRLVDGHEAGPRVRTVRWWLAPCARCRFLPWWWFNRPLSLHHRDSIS